MNARWPFIRQAIERTLDRARRPKLEPKTEGWRTWRPRWSVCIGGYPNGWDSPKLETDDVGLAIAEYEQVRADLGHRRWTTVAIFDDNGEGEPLDPDRIREKLREELWAHGWHRAADEAPDGELPHLYAQMRAEQGKAGI